MCRDVVVVELEGGELGEFCCHGELAHCGRAIDEDELRDN